MLTVGTLGCQCFLVLADEAGEERRQELATCVRAGSGA